MGAIFRYLMLVLYTAHSRAIDVSTIPIQRVPIGTNLTLQCNYTEPSTDPNFIIRSWSKGSDQIYQKSDTADPVIGPKYLGRVLLTDSDASIIITEIQLHDEGEYKCSINFYVAAILGEALTAVNVTVGTFGTSIQGYDDGETIQGSVETDIELVCSAFDAKPPADIQWSIDGSNIDATETTYTYDNIYDDFANTTSTLIYMPNKGDEGKVLEVNCTTFQAGIEAQSYGVKINIGKDVKNGKNSELLWLLWLLIIPVFIIIYFIVIYCVRKKGRECIEGLQVSGKTDRSVTLTWKAKPSGCLLCTTIKYEIAYKKDGGDEERCVADTPPYTINNLNPATKYLFRMKTDIADDYAFCECRAETLGQA